MTGETWSALIVGILSGTLTPLVVARITGHYSTRANRVKAEAEAEGAARAEEIRATAAPYADLVEELRASREEMRLTRAEADAKRAAADARYAAADARASSAEAALAQVRTLTLDIDEMRIHIQPLLDWIDRGCPPPPPYVHPRLRAILGLETQAERTDLA